MRCPHCGNELTQDFAYCPHCGKPTDAPAAPVAAARPAAPAMPAPTAPDAAQETSSLIDEENEERAEGGLPPVPGGAKKAGHGGAVAAAVVVGIIAVAFIAVVGGAIWSVWQDRDQPRWDNGSSFVYGDADVTDSDSGNATSPDLSTTDAPDFSGVDSIELPVSYEDACGRWYAFWRFTDGGDDETWGYIFDLYEDGTGEFRLFLCEDGTNFTREQVDAEEYTEAIRWTQNGSAITIDNLNSDALPDAPNGYLQCTEDGHRVLVPAEGEYNYKYPGEVMYEDYDMAIQNMSE